MADYYTRLSLIVPLPHAAAQKYALDLAATARRYCSEDEPLPSDFPESLAEVMEEWHFETEAERREGQWGLWLHSDYGGMGAACAFIQHLLQKFEAQGRVAFEWSCDCNKPLVDAFGGGAAVITAQEIKTMTTSDWIGTQTA